MSLPATQQSSDALSPAGWDQARYNTHLTSLLWEQQRQSAFRRWGKFCNCCGEREDLTVHHLFYRNISDCADNDLMPLCLPCHDVFHAINPLPYPLASERDHMDKRRLTIRRILRFRFGAFKDTTPQATIDRTDVWRAKKLLKHRPEWRFVDYSKIPNRTILEAAANPNFQVQDEWLIRGTRPVLRNRQPA